MANFKPNVDKSYRWDTALWIFAGIFLLAALSSCLLETTAGALKIDLHSRISQISFVIFSVCALASLIVAILRAKTARQRPPLTKLEMKSIVLTYATLGTCIALINAEPAVINYHDGHPYSFEVRTAILTALPFWIAVIYWMDRARRTLATEPRAEKGQ